MIDPNRARRFWQLFEPIHAVVYFAPNARETYSAIGLKGGWMGYFASRSAAMGPVPAEIVTATFYNFHPSMVRRAIPDAWRFSTPAAILEARLGLADSVLRLLFGNDGSEQAVADAGELMTRVVEACDISGRPLAGAHIGLDRPAEPLLGLWWAATCLREHRGDGHVATLVADDIDGCQAHVLMVAATGMSPEGQRAFRGWSEEEWEDARARLAARGLVDDEGALTPEGAGLHVAIERRTDELAAAPFRALAEDELDRLEGSLVPLTKAIMSSAGVPYPNPIGLTRPEL